MLPDGDAVGRGRGGRTRAAVVAPLDEATRGIVWTASSGAGELEAVLDAHPRVGWVQLPWAGVDAFAGVLRRFAGDGRVWTSAKGAYAQPVAEHALMLALAVLREVPRRVRAGRWEVDERGRSLYGAEVVIVGAGGIADGAPAPAAAVRRPCHGRAPARRSRRRCRAHGDRRRAPRCAGAAPRWCSSPRRSPRASRGLIGAAGARADAAGRRARERRARRARRHRRPRRGARVGPTSAVRAST